MKYNKKYHNIVHNQLINDIEYYNCRAYLGFNRYFKDINQLSNKKILEFGCGLGQNIFNIKENQVFGYDISNFALNFCKNKGIKILSNLKKNETFDIILCSQVLEHLESPFYFLNFFKEKLKKNGLLILSLPYEKNYISSLNPDYVDNHLYSFTFRTINNLLDLTGYKVIQNRFIYGTMYKKLKFLYKINPKLYYYFTNFFGRILNHKELKIIALKK